MRHHLIKAVLIISILISGAAFSQGNYTPPSGSPLANHEHPRLFITGSSLPQIRNYINTYAAADFQIFVNALDASFQEAPSGKTRNYLLYDAANYAFLYLLDPALMTNFHFVHTREQYANKAWEHAQVIFGKSWYDNHNSPVTLSSGQGGYINLSLAVIYDWMFPWLSTAQKQAIADKLIERFDNRISSANPGQQPVLSNDIINQIHSGSFGGIAIYGDNLGSSYDVKAQEMLNYMRDMYIERVYRTANHIFEGSAGWGEGPTYMYLGMFGADLFTGALTTATGQNWFYDCTQFRFMPWYVYASINPQQLTDYVKNVPTYYFTRNNAVSLQKASEETYSFLIIPAIANLKNADPDMAGLGKWLLRDSPYYLTEDDIDNYPRLFHLFFRYIWGIEDVPSRSPQQLNLPLANRFGLGETILRSDHTTEATRIIFYTPKYYYTPHKSNDMASFVIEKFGNLLVDGGVSKGQSSLPKSRYTGSPIFMNQMGVYDPSDTTLDSRVYKYEFTLIGKGDIYSDPELQEGGSYNVGNLKAFDANNSNYDYLNYDYTRSHSRNNKVTGANRELLYIRPDGGPNEEYVVIYDRISVGNGNHKKRFIMRPSFDASLVDGSWNQIGSHHWESTDASTIEIENNFQEAHGKLYVKILEPANHKIIKRGGDPDMWFTDALGNDMKRNGPFLEWGAYWASKYRIEVEAGGNNTSEDFLHVMQLGDANTLNQMVNVEKIDVQNFIGALINGNRLAMFNKSGTPRTTISYTISTNKFVKHIVTGLDRGFYTVEVDGNNILSDGQVDRKGVLYFEHQGGGTFQIFRTATGLGDDDETVGQATTPVLHQNYPNPFNPETTISFFLPLASTVFLRIYDVNGRLVKKLANEYLPAGDHQLRWDGRDQQGNALASGVYLYQLQTGGFVQSKKMLLIK